MGRGGAYTCFVVITSFFSQFLCISNTIKLPAAVVVWPNSPPMTPASQWYWECLPTVWRIMGLTSVVTKYHSDIFSSYIISDKLILLPVYSNSSFRAIPLWEQHCLHIKAYLLFGPSPTRYSITWNNQISVGGPLGQWLKEVYDMSKAGNNSNNFT